MHKCFAAYQHRRKISNIVQTIIGLGTRYYHQYPMMKKPLPPIAYIAAIFTIISCQSSSGNQGFTVPDVVEVQREKTAEEIKQELALKESQSPSEYLKSQSTFRKNFIGETVLEGRIDNTATMANFKDIVVEATFLAASGTELARQEFTRYEVVGHGYGVTFKFKTFAPEQTNSVAVRVIRAIPVE